MEQNEKRRVLGLDTGTNSIGWAVIDRTGDNCSLVDSGVHIFTEGVKIEKGIESSKAAERTDYRALRRGYYRRKLRKIRLLRILSDLGWCPTLSPTLLSQWRLHKIYPATDDFMQWLATDDKNEINPYRLRVICLREKLDLEQESQRYMLGRALYHIAQRRGFRSNRKEQLKEGDEETGKVKEGISELSAAMSAAGCEYLSEYFYSLYKEGERIRKHYTSRDEHYLAEFNAICARQGIDDETIERLRKVIFDQRPLKSQKHSVGRCVFEQSKTRCLMSHPDFEEMRMLQMVNQIRIKTPYDRELRPLSEIERKKIMPLFMRKSKPSFDFIDIAKELSKEFGKKNYGYIKTDTYRDGMVMFNYPMDMNVSGMPFTAGIASVFGDDWKDVINGRYDVDGNKTCEEKVDDVWHALLFFEDNAKLSTWLQCKLGIDADRAYKLTKVKITDAYASLSHKVIKKILPFMRCGMIYSYAVMLANLDAVLPEYVRDNDDMRQAAIDMSVECLESYDRKTCDCTMYQCLKNFLEEKYHIDKRVLKKLYHPSDLETYPRVRPDDEGRMRLGSPNTTSVRNPMAMRSLHCIRHVVNALLDNGTIDSETEVHIELGRELNDANMRAAIRRQNSDNEKKRDAAKKEISKYISEENKIDTAIDKYLLWEEQSGICFYTGATIGLTDLFGPSAKFDIEHTIPRSRGGDNTMENLTLCDSRFNREVKKTMLPSELSNADDILQRVAFMKENMDDLIKQIRKCKSNPGMEKEIKDRVIQKRHKLELQLMYWRNKYARFEMTEVPEDFSRRQGATAGIVARYARLYLKSLFNDVSIVKGAATADFRKAWSLQDEKVKKDRDNHTHHEIDAIVIACIGRGDYQRLAASYHLRGYADRVCPDVPEPWKDFRKDICRIQHETLVSYARTDNMPKQGRKRIKVNRGSHHKKADQRMCRYACGDAARLSLHMSTNYGAIERDGEVKYVVRKAIDTLKEADIKSIVDDVVRQKVQAAYDLRKDKAFAEPIWMNEAKGIQIKKVRCYASLSNPVSLRKHRDVSRHEYKTTGHFLNDGNYCIAIYEQNLPQGSTKKAKRSFKVVSNLAAAAYYKTSNRNKNESLIPQEDNNGYLLKMVLHKGDSVLMYENSPEELYNASQEELCRRLYVVAMIMTDGRVTFKYAQETKAGEANRKLRTVQERREFKYAQETKAGEGVAGDYKIGEKIRPFIRHSSSKLKILIQDRDFTIDVLGKIKFIKHD